MAQNDIVIVKPVNAIALVIDDILIVYFLYADRNAVSSTAFRKPKVCLPSRRIFRQQESKPIMHIIATWS